MFHELCKKFVLDTNLFKISIFVTFCKKVYFFDKI